MVGTWKAGPAEPSGLAATIIREGRSLEPMAAPIRSMNEPIAVAVRSRKKGRLSRREEETVDSRPAPMRRDRAGNFNSALLKGLMAHTA